MIQFLRRPVLAEGRAAVSETLGWLTEYRVAIALAIGLGVLVRVYQVERTAFPLNDGGLFFSMTRDLEASNFRIPAFTTYNGGHIPFAYPPLGFYLAAILDRLTPLSLTEIFRFLPLVATSLTLLAVLKLARTMLKDDIAVIAAVFAFACVPRSFIWLLMGGGITRAFGMLFAIFALEQVYRLYHDRDSRRLIPAALLSAATVLSHLETGWFLAFSIAVFWVVLGHNRHGFKMSALLAGSVLALTAPWWGSVIGYHGLRPFLDANGSGGTFFTNPDDRHIAIESIKHLTATSEPYFPLIGALGVVGVAIAAATGRYLVPLWWLTIFVLDIRSFATFSAVPVALMTGITVSELIVPALQRGAARMNANNRLNRFLSRPRTFGLAIPALAVLMLAIYYVSSGAFVHDPRSESATLVSLAPEEIDVMHWAAAETGSDDRFVVIPSTPWETAKEAEWFPAMADRTSLATVQGSEWLPNHEFDRRIWEHNWLWGCGNATTACLTSWIRASGLDFTYLWLPGSGGRSCCDRLLTSILEDPAYITVYTNDGNYVFKKTVSYTEGPALAAN